MLNRDFFTRDVNFLLWYVSFSLFDFQHSSQVCYKLDITLTTWRFHCLHYCPYFLSCRIGISRAHWHERLANEAVRWTLSATKKWRQKQRASDRPTSAQLWAPLPCLCGCSVKTWTVPNVAELFAKAFANAHRAGVGGRSSAALLSLALALANACRLGAFAHGGAGGGALGKLFAAAWARPQRARAQRDRAQPAQPRADGAWPAAGAWIEAPCPGAVGLQRIARTTEGRPKARTARIGLLRFATQPLLGAAEVEGGLASHQPQNFTVAATGWQWSRKKPFLRSDCGMTPFCVASGFPCEGNPCEVWCLDDLR